MRCVRRPYAWFDRVYVSLLCCVLTSAAHIHVYVGHMQRIAIISSKLMRSKWSFVAECMCCRSNIVQYASRIYTTIVADEIIAFRTLNITECTNAQWLTGAVCAIFAFAQTFTDYKLE